MLCVYTGLGTYKPSYSIFFVVISAAMSYMLILYPVGFWNSCNSVFFIECTQFCAQATENRQFCSNLYGLFPFLLPHFGSENLQRCVGRGKRVYSWINLRMR